MLKHSATVFTPAINSSKELKRRLHDVPNQLPYKVAGNGKTT